MREVIEERRILLSQDGEDSSEEPDVGVSRIGPGMFRVEDNLAFWDWVESNLPELGDDNHDSAGWILEVEELEDGRLKVLSAREDPNVISVCFRTLPSRFVDSDAYQRLAVSILELGGNCEVVWGGLFAGYVPREAALKAGFDFDSALMNSVSAWEQSFPGNG